MEALHSGVSAGLAGIFTEIIFYGLDSYKVFSQAGGEVKISRLFRGAVPVALLGSGPSFGVFFLFYNPLRDFTLSKLGPGQESVSVLLASVVSCVPSSIVGVPADVIKKRLLLTTTNVTHSNSSFPVTSVRHVVSDIVRIGGLRQLFLGWQANMLKDIPFCGIKMSLYEGIARMYLQYKHKTLTAPTAGSYDMNTKTNMITENIPNNHNSSFKLSMHTLSRLESAGVGFLSGFFTAIVTCPIDCVNTRIKSGELAQFGIFKAHIEIVRCDGVTALFRGIVPRTLILGCGSTVFWYLESWFRNAIRN